MEGDIRLSRIMAPWSNDIVRKVTLQSVLHNYVDNWIDKSQNPKTLASSHHYLIWINEGCTNVLATWTEKEPGGAPQNLSLSEPNPVRSNYIRITGSIKAVWDPSILRILLVAQRSLPGMARWDRGMSHRAQGRWDIQLSMGSSPRLGSLHPHTEDILSSDWGSERTFHTTCTKKILSSHLLADDNLASAIRMRLNCKSCWRTYAIRPPRSPDQPNRSNLHKGRRRGLKVQACTTGGRSSQRVPKCHGWTLNMHDDTRRSTLSHLRGPAQWGRWIRRISASLSVSPLLNSCT